jgi:hypothetical protein
MEFGPEIIHRAENPMEEWDEFDWNAWRPSTEGCWFLFEPAEPPFPCIPPEAEMWLALERQMWGFYVLASLSDEVKPLFPDECTNRDGES